VFIKTDVLGGPHWVLGPHSDVCRLWSFPSVPFCLPPRCHQDKKLAPLHCIVPAQTGRDQEVHRA